MPPKESDQLQNGAEIAPGPLFQHGYRDLFICPKGLATGLKTQQVVIATLREVLICSDPIDSLFELSQSSCCLRFNQCLPLALLILFSGLCYEQATVAKCPHKIREVVMGFSLIHVGNTVGRANRRVNIVSAGKSWTHIAALIGAHMRVVFAKQG